MSAGRPMDPELIFHLPSDVLRIEDAVEKVVARCRRHIELERRASRVRMNLQVALAEALANAMLYGNGADRSKRVRVELTITEKAIITRVTDEGPGFDYRDIPDPTTREGLLKPDGRGIFLMRKLLDQVSFNERGNSVTLLLKRDPVRRE